VKPRLSSPGLFLLIVALTPPARGGDFTYRGNARETVSADLQKDDPVEHLFGSNLRLFAEGRYGAGDLSATASFLGRFEVMAPRNRVERFNLNLYEAYLRWARGIWALEGGARMLRWGVMEYVSPTDALNSRDLTQLTDPEVEDTYLPVPMLRVVADPKPWTFELVYQPFFRSSRFDLVGTDSSFYRPSLPAYFGFPYAAQASALGQSTAAALADLSVSKPKDNPLRGDAGLRIGWTWEHLDLSAVYLYKRDTLPAFALPNGYQALDPANFSVSSGLPSQQGFFPRSHLAGGTLRWVLDSGFTFKGEALYKHDSTAYDSRLFLLRKPEVTWTLGADYDWDLTHLFTLEYAQDRLLNSSGLSFFGTDRVQHIISAAALLNFDARTWTVELKGTAMPNQRAYFLNPRIRYRPTPPWELALGLNVWGGRNASLFGLISNNDEVFGSVKYLF
jgi:hypothetical protein